jgi:uncharacterized protein YidB (DUF937 family)
MDLLQLGTQLLTNYFKGDVSSDNTSNALSGLLGDGQGGLNIMGIVSKMNSNSGLSNIVGSWLGDGENGGIQTGQLQQLFGNDALSSFSKSLGQTQERATEGLGNMLPQLIDKSSSGGNLFSNDSGFDNAFDLAKKLF